MARVSTANRFGAIIAVIGAAGSLFLLMTAGRGAPVILLALFIGWVALPFAALAAANFYANRWSPATRTALFAASLLVFSAALFIYCWVTFWPPSSTPARTWLLVPAASWLAIIAAAICGHLSNRRSKDGINRPLR